MIEYCYIDTHGSITIERLNELGREGWIFASLYRVRAPTNTYIFYREVKEVEYTAATRSIEGEVFTLERDPDGFVWAFPDGSHTDVYQIGHDIRTAQLAFDKNAERLAREWQTRKPPPA